MRLFLLTGILALLSMPAMSAEILETDIFRLEMKGDWKKVPTNDAEQFMLISRKMDVSLTLSTMKFKETGVDLERMTRKLQESRLSGENSAGRKFNRKIEIAEPLLTIADRGWHLQYFGKDNTGRKFRYYGIVAPGKLMNLYAESSSANLEQLEVVLQEVFKGLQF